MGICVVHEGYGENRQLSNTYCDGINWQPDTQVHNVGLSDAPGALVFGGDIYVFHQGIFTGPRAT
jgi:hypothetical protein